MNKAVGFMADIEAAQFALDQHSLVSMTDLKGTIIYANKKFVEVSGYNEEELLGENHRLLNSNQHSKDYWRKMYLKVSKGNVWHDEVRNTNKEGEFYWVDTTIVPNFDGDILTGYISIRTDITPQKDYEELLVSANKEAESAQLQAESAQLQAESAQLQAESAQFAMNQHSLVSNSDIKGNITYANKKFLAISGYSEEELLGKNHRLLNSGNQPPSYWKHMHESVLAGHVWHDEVRNIAKDGHFYWVDTTIVPNYNNGVINGFTSIRTEITKQKENLELLEIAKKAAEAANISKADFLANMSHEIRTPMNGVIGMTNLLLNTSLTKEQLKLIKTVKASGESLLSIINDILDFSKVESGKLDLEFLDFNLGQMIEDLGSTMSFQTENKGLQLICPATPVINQWVKADPGRIRQVLTNLLGNAIKFTEHGEIAVHISIKEASENSKQFLFEIRDTGIGINEDQQNNIFSQFSQADTSTTRKYGGTGLGLSISKSLIELMGGEIGVQSTVGIGSTFWFTLNLEVATNIEEPQFYPADLSIQKVLIVDDNATNLDLMHQLHDIWGVPHSLVDNGQDALVELQKADDAGSPYSIAVIDMNMPKMDGVELSQYILQNKAFSKIKLIMATSQAQRGDAQKMHEAGFSGYLTKPIHQSELFDILLQVSGLKEDSQQLITRYTLRDKQQFCGHVLVVEDNATNQLVIEGLLSAFGLNVDLAGNGEEAISALQRGDHHDLIFMDCQMPIMDGYIATGKIRSSTNKSLNSNIPIIAMTANAMAGDKQKCLDAGMDDYISKPINPEIVAKKLQQWLPKNNIKSQQNVDTSEKPIKTSSNEPVFDFDAMSKRLMHKADLMMMVFQQFSTDLKDQIVELQTAIEQKNNIDIAAIGHKIKGSSANVGGLALSAIALKIETAGKADNIDNVSKLLKEIERAAEALIIEMKDKLK